MLIMLFMLAALNGEPFSIPAIFALCVFFPELDGLTCSPRELRLVRFIGAIVVERGFSLGYPGSDILASSSGSLISIAEGPEPGPFPLDTATCGKLMLLVTVPVEF